MLISLFFVILQVLIYIALAMDERLDKVKVQCDYLPLINFAMQQNGASIIHQISIENTTHAPLKDVQVQITTEPAFGNSVPTVIEAIPANDRVCLQTFNLTLSTNYFTQLTERLSGSLKVEITSETKAIFSQTYPIDILAYDQWGGLNVLPEMLAAFITPNHAVISPVIKRAATILEQWTGNPSLDEYQSRNPDRVRKQMAPSILLSPSNRLFTALSRLALRSTGNASGSPIPSWLRSWGLAWIWRCFTPPAWKLSD